MGNQTYIYALLEPNGTLDKPATIRYIGKANDPDTRFRVHLSRAQQYEHTPKGQWMVSLLERQQRPLLSILECCSRESCQEREIYWIDYYRKRGSPLTNAKPVGRFDNKTLATYYIANDVLETLAVWVASNKTSGLSKSQVVERALCRFCKQPAFSRPYQKRSSGKKRASYYISNDTLGLLESVWAATRLSRSRIAEEAIRQWLNQRG